MTSPPPHPPIETYLGIDGGGTSTRCVIVERSADGKLGILGEGRGDSGNLHDVGAERLREHLGHAWGQAWSAAGREPTPSAAVFCGMASVVTPTDRAAVRDAVVGVGMARAEDVQVDHDLRIALAGGLAGRSGIVSIAGTGSSCFGRNASGDTWMAGGWGSFLDDRGSSFDLGRGAMIACARAHDRRGRETLLSATLQDRLGIGEWRELLARVDAEGLTRAEVASLAPLVTDAANADDPVALELIDNGTAALAECVATVARELDVSDPRVTATGGLASSGTTWWRSYERAVIGLVPAAHVVPSSLSPLHGAALLAIEAAGVAIDGAIIESWTDRHRSR